MYFFRLSLLCAAGIFCNGVIAATALPSPKAHPRVFCELAADVGYPSRGFKDDAGICATNMTDVSPTPGRNMLRNNLAFYSMAQDEAPTKLHRVSLILNVNNTQEKAMAYAELVRVASSVAVKIVGQPPAGFADVIRTAGSKTWTAGAWIVEVRSKQWPTGLGQDTVVYFRPTAGS